MKVEPTWVCGDAPVVESWEERALAAMRTFIEAMDRGDEEAESESVMQIEQLVNEKGE